MPAPQLNPTAIQAGYRLLHWAG